MVGYHVAARDMTQTSDWEKAALTALRVSPSPSAPQYKMAWVAALLGFVAILLSFVIYVYYWERLTDYWQGQGHDIDTIRDISRLGTISGYAFYIGTVFIVASIVLVVCGLSVDDDRRRSGTVLIGTLSKLKWIAIFALFLYLISTVFIIAFGESWLGFSSYDVMRLMYYPSRAADAFLAALPLIIAHTLNKPRV
jgi:low temperature requirement protein LtrA